MPYRHQVCIIVLGEFRRCREVAGAGVASEGRCKGALQSRCTERLLKLGWCVELKTHLKPSRISVACIAAEVIIAIEHDESMTWRNVLIVWGQNG
jgi:hypothetical protein